MSTKNASILFAAVIGVRATAYLFSKLLLVDMGPFMLMGIRFLLAFVLLAIVFNKSMRSLTRATLLHGVVLGALFFIVMGFELVSLTLTASSTVAFLENTAIVFVPLFEAPVLPQTPLAWGYLAILVVMCTCFGFAFQPIAQRGISSERAALLLAVSPLIAAVLGIVVLGESFGPSTLAGMVLILGGIVVSSVHRKTERGCASLVRSDRQEARG